jgi:hypothetical protein
LAVVFGCGPVVYAASFRAEFSRLKDPFRNPRVQAGRGGRFSIFDLSEMFGNWGGDWED